MKALVNIYFTTNPIEENDKLQITVGCSENEYNLDVYTDVNEPLSNIINSSNLQKSANDFIKYSILGDKEDKKLLKHLSKNSVLRDYLLTDSIEIYGEFAEISTYLATNPELANKKIVIGNVLDIDLNQLAALKKNIDLQKYNVLIKIQGNSHPITITEYEKTIAIVNEIVTKIKCYNYSPLEILIHVYDLIRDRVYVKEDDNQKYYESRDLTSVLLGDKIVCLGYVRLFNTILEQLGFKCIDFILDVNQSDESHARSLVYLKDDKYNINGLYFFDPTFDSKRNENSLSFLNSYLYFAKTYNQLIPNEKDKFTYITYKYFDTDQIMRFEDEMLNNHPPHYKIATRIVNDHINWLLRFAGKEFMAFSSTNLNMEEVIENMYEVADLANQPIDVHSFLEALYNVRKNEYYEQPHRFAFDMDSLTNILINSKLLDTQNELLQLYNAIFGVCLTVDQDQAHNLVSDFFAANSLDLDMSRVKLARVLKNVYEKKINEQTLKK